MSSKLFRWVYVRAEVLPADPRRVTLLNGLVEKTGGAPAPDVIPHTDPGAISFQHTFVWASSESDAYCFGGRVLDKLGRKPGSVMNDYVVMMNDQMKNEQKSAPDFWPFKSVWPAVVLAISFLAVLVVAMIDNVHEQRKLPDFVPRPSFDGSMHSVTWGGHTWLEYQGGSGGGTVIHDPDCLCHLKRTPEKEP